MKNDRDLMQVSFLEDINKIRRIRDLLKDKYGITIAQQHDMKFRSRNHAQNLQFGRVDLNRTLNSKIDEKLLRDFGNEAVDRNENDFVRELYDTIKDIKIDSQV